MRHAVNPVDINAETLSQEDRCEVLSNAFLIKPEPNMECRFEAFYEHYDHTDKDSNVSAEELNLSIQRARVTSQHQFSAGALDGTLGSIRVSIADSILHFAMSMFHDLINAAFYPDVPSV